MKKNLLILLLTSSTLVVNGQSVNYDNSVVNEHDSSHLTTSPLPTSEPSVQTKQYLLSVLEINSITDSFFELICLSEKKDTVFVFSREEKGVDDYSTYEEIRVGESYMFELYRTTEDVQRVIFGGYTLLLAGEVYWTTGDEASKYPYQVRNTSGRYILKEL